MFNTVKLLSFSIYLVLITHASSSDLSSYSEAYCEAGPTSTQDSNLGHVYLMGETKNITDPTDCPGQYGVQDLTTEVADLMQGKIYELTYHVTTCGGPYNRISAVWIDFNGDGVFNTSEQIGNVKQTSDTPDDRIKIAIKVPQNLSNLNTVMRVMVQEESDPEKMDPCAMYAYGGVKDFGIQIIDHTPTPPPPPLPVSNGVFLLYSDSECKKNSLQIHTSNVTWGTQE